MAEVTERRLVQQFPLYYDLYVPEGEKPKPLIIALSAVRRSGFADSVNRRHGRARRGLRYRQ